MTTVMQKRPPTPPSTSPPSDSPAVTAPLAPPQSTSPPESPKLDAARHYTYRPHLLPVDLDTGKCKLQHANELTLASYSMTVWIQDFLCDAHSTMTFLNKHTEPTAAVFTVPVDETSSVYQLDYEINGEVVHAECREREQARSTYTESVMQGHTAAVSQQIHNMRHIFSCTIANIPPQATVTVHMAQVTELLPDIHGGLTVRMPLVLRPRYGPSQEYFTSSELFEEVTSVDSSTNTVEHPDPMLVSFTAHFNGGLVLKKISEPNGRLLIQYLNEAHTQATAELITEDLTFDKDLVMTVKYKKSPSPVIVAEEGCRSQGGVLKKSVAMLTFYPELAAETSSGTSGEYIFLIDRSMSMEGKRSKDASAALRVLLEELPTGCLFNIITFAAESNYLFKEYSKAKTKHTIREAYELIDNLPDCEEGSNILTALQRVYETPSKPDNPRQLFLITDGEVRNTLPIVSLVDANSDDTRVFTIGVGYGVSVSLLRGVAEAGRGRCDFLYDMDHLQNKMCKLMRCARQLSVPDVNLDWTLPRGVSVLVQPQILPPLYNHHKWVAYAVFSGKIRPTDELIARMSVWIDESAFTHTLKFRVKPPLDTAKQQPLPIHRMLAKMQIAQLEMNKDEYTSDKDFSTILALSTTANVLSRYTVFVSVDEHSRPIKAHDKVPMMQQLTVKEQEDMYDHRTTSHLFTTLFNEDKKRKRRRVRFVLALNNMFRGSARSRASMRRKNAAEREKLANKDNAKKSQETEDTKPAVITPIETDNKIEELDDEKKKEHLTLEKKESDTNYAKQYEAPGEKKPLDEVDNGKQKKEEEEETNLSDIVILPRFRPEKNKREAPIVEEDEIAAVAVERKKPAETLPDDWVDSFVQVLEQQDKGNVILQLEGLEGADGDDQMRKTTDVELQCAAPGGDEETIATAVHVEQEETLPQVEEEEFVAVNVKREKGDIQLFPEDEQLQTPTSPDDTKPGGIPHSFRMTFSKFFTMKNKDDIPVPKQDEPLGDGGASPTTTDEAESPRSPTDSHERSGGQFRFKKIFRRGSKIKPKSGSDSPPVGGGVDEGGAAGDVTVSGGDAPGTSTERGEVTTTTTTTTAGGKITITSERTEKTEYYESKVFTETPDGIVAPLDQPKMQLDGDEKKRRVPSFKLTLPKFGKKKDAEEDENKEKPTEGEKPEGDEEDEEKKPETETKETKEKKRFQLPSVSMNMPTFFHRKWEPEQPPKQEADKPDGEEDKKGEGEEKDGEKEATGSRRSSVSSAGEKRKLDTSEDVGGDVVVASTSDGDDKPKGTIVVNIQEPSDEPSRKKKKLRPSFSMSMPQILRKRKPEEQPKEQPEQTQHKQQQPKAEPREEAQPAGDDNKEQAKAAGEPEEGEPSQKNKDDDDGGAADVDVKVKKPKGRPIFEPFINYINRKVPKRKTPQAEIVVDIKEPGKDEPQKVQEVELKTPEVEVPDVGAKVEVQEPEVDVTIKKSIDEPKINVPTIVDVTIKKAIDDEPKDFAMKIEQEAPKVDVEVRHVEVDAPEVEVEVPKLEVAVKEPEIDGGAKIEMSEDITQVRDEFGNIEEQIKRVKEKVKETESVERSESGNVTLVTREITKVTVVKKKIVTGGEIQIEGPDVPELEKPEVEGDADVKHEIEVPAIPESPELELNLKVDVTKVEKKDDEDDKGNDKEQPEDKETGVVAVGGDEEEKEKPEGKVIVNITEPAEPSTSKKGGFSIRLPKFGRSKSQAAADDAEADDQNKQHKPKKGRTLPRMKFAPFAKRSTKKAADDEDEESPKTPPPSPTESREEEKKPDRKSMSWRFRGPGFPRFNIKGKQPQQPEETSAGATATVEAPEITEDLPYLESKVFTEDDDGTLHVKQLEGDVPIPDTSTPAPKPMQGEASPKSKRKRPASFKITFHSPFDRSSLDRDRKGSKSSTDEGPSPSPVSKDDYPYLGHDTLKDTDGDTTVIVVDAPDVDKPDVAIDKKTGRPIFEPVINFINKRAPKLKTKRGAPQGEIVVDIKEPGKPDDSAATPGGVAAAGGAAGGTASGDKQEDEEPEPTGVLEPIKSYIRTTPDDEDEAKAQASASGEIVVNIKEPAAPALDIHTKPGDDDKQEDHKEEGEAEAKEKKSKKAFKPRISLDVFTKKEPKTSKDAVDAEIVVNIKEPKIDLPSGEVEIEVKDAKVEEAEPVAKPDEDEKAKGEEPEVPEPAAAAAAGGSEIKQKEKTKKPKRSILAPVVTYYNKKLNKKPKDMPEANIVVDIKEPAGPSGKDEGEATVAVAEVKLPEPTTKDDEQKQDLPEPKEEEKKDEAEEGSKDKGEDEETDKPVAATAAAEGEIVVDVTEPKVKKTGRPVFEPFILYVNKKTKSGGTKKPAVPEAEIVVDIKEPEKPQIEGEIEVELKEGEKPEPSGEEEKKEEDDGKKKQETPSTEPAEDESKEKKVPRKKFTAGFGGFLKKPKKAPEANIVVDIKEPEVNADVKPTAADVDVQVDKPDASEPDAPAATAAADVSGEVKIDVSAPDAELKATGEADVEVPKAESSEVTVDISVDGKGKKPKKTTRQVFAPIINVFKRPKTKEPEANIVVNITEPATPAEDVEPKAAEVEVKTEEAALPQPPALPAVEVAGDVCVPDADVEGGDVVVVSRTETFEIINTTTDTTDKDRPGAHIMVDIKEPQMPTIDIEPPSPQLSFDHQVVIDKNITGPEPVEVQTPEIDVHITEGRDVEIDGQQQGDLSMHKNSRFPNISGGISYMKDKLQNIPQSTKDHPDANITVNINEPQMPDLTIESPTPALDIKHKETIDSEISDPEPPRIQQPEININITDGLEDVNLDAQGKGDITVPKGSRSPRIAAGITYIKDKIHHIPVSTQQDHPDAQVVVNIKEPQTPELETVKPDLPTVSASVNDNVIEKPRIDVEKPDHGLYMKQSDQVNVDVDKPEAPAAGGEINVEFVNVDVKTEDTNVKMHKGFKRPKLHERLPNIKRLFTGRSKSDRKDIPDAQIIVDIKEPPTPGIETKTPDVDVQQPEIGLDIKQGGSISVDSNKAEEPRVAAGEINVEIVDKAVKKREGFKMPKLGGLPNVKSPFTGMSKANKKDLPDGQIVVDIQEPEMPNIEMKKPDMDVDQPEDELGLKQGGSINVDIDKPEEPHVAAGEINISVTDRDVKSRDSDTKASKSFKMPKLHGGLPKIRSPIGSLSRLVRKDHPDAHIIVDIKEPQKPDLETKQPELDIEQPELELGTKQGGSINIDIDETEELHIAGGEVDVDITDADIKMADTDGKIRKGFKMSKLREGLPDIKSSFGSMSKADKKDLPDAQIVVDIKEPQSSDIQVKKPDIDSELPEGELDLKQGGSIHVAIDKPDEPHVTAGGINVTVTDVDMKSGDSDIKAREGFKMPKLKVGLPNIKSPFSNMSKAAERKDLPDAQIVVDIKEPQTPDVEIEKPDIDIDQPEHELEIKQGGSINVDIDKPEKPQIAAGDINVNITDVDVESEDRNIKAHKDHPDAQIIIDIKEPQTTDIEKKSDVDVELPEHQIDTKQGGSINVDIGKPGVASVVVEPEDKDIKTRKKGFKRPHLHGRFSNMKSSFGSMSKSIRQDHPDAQIIVDIEEPQKPELEIKKPELHIEQPELELDIKKGGSTNVDIDRPEEPPVALGEINVEITDVDVKSGDSDLKIQKGFKMPKLHSGLPHIKSPFGSMSKAEKKDLPDAQIVVDIKEPQTPDVEVKKPDIDVDQPKYELEIAQGGSIDVDIDKPGEPQIAAGEINVNITDVEPEDRDIKARKGIEMPKLHGGLLSIKSPLGIMSKSDREGHPDSQIIIDIKEPQTPDIEIKKSDVDVELPKHQLEIKEGGSINVDIGKPDVTGVVVEPEDKDIKARKKDFKRPKLHGGLPSIKNPFGSMSKSTRKDYSDAQIIVNIKEPETPDHKTKKPEIDVEQREHDLDVTQGGSIKVDIDKHAEPHATTGEINVEIVDVDGKRGDADIKTRKGFKIPRLRSGFPSITSPLGSMSKTNKKDLPEAQIVVDIKEPQIPDIEIKKPDTSVEQPDHELEIKQGGSLNVDDEIPEKPHAAGEINVEISDVDLGTEDKDINKKEGFKMPTFHGGLPHIKSPFGSTSKADKKDLPDAQIIVDIKEPSTPDVEIKRPDIDAECSEKEFDTNQGGSINVDIDKPEELHVAGEINVDVTDVAVKPREKTIKTHKGFKMPNLHGGLPNIKIPFGSKSISDQKDLPDAQIIVDIKEPQMPGIDIKKSDVVVEQPELELHVKQGDSINVNIDKPEVPHVAAAGEINVDITDADVNTEDRNVKAHKGFKMPKLRGGLPDIKSSLGSMRKADRKDLPAAQIIVDIKEPQTPGIKVEKPDIDVENAELDLETKQGGSINVNIDKPEEPHVAAGEVDVDVPDVVVKPGDKDIKKHKGFQMPKLHGRLPNIKSPFSRKSRSTLKDLPPTQIIVDIKEPQTSGIEIQKPDIEIEQSELELDIKQGGNLNVDIGKLEESHAAGEISVETTDVIVKPEDKDIKTRKGFKMPKLHSELANIKSPFGSMTKDDQKDLPDAQIIVDIKEPQTSGIEMKGPHVDVEKPGHELGGTINVDIDKREESHVAPGEINIEVSDAVLEPEDEDIKTHKKVFKRPKLHGGLPNIKSTFGSMGKSNRKEHPDAHILVNVMEPHSPQIQASVTPILDGEHGEIKHEVEEPQPLVIESSEINVDISDDKKVNVQGEGDVSTSKGPRSPNFQAGISFIKNKLHDIPKSPAKDHPDAEIVVNINEPQMPDLSKDSQTPTLDIEHKLTIDSEISSPDPVRIQQPEINVNITDGMEDVNIDAQGEGDINAPKDHPDAKIVVNINEPQTPDLTMDSEVSGPEPLKFQQPEINVNITDGMEDVNLDAQGEGDISVPKGSSSPHIQAGISFVKQKLDAIPKFAEKSHPEGEITVNITEPAPKLDVNIEEPTVDVDIKEPAAEIDVKEPSVDVKEPELPDVEVKKPAVPGGEITVDIKEPEVPAAGPSGTVAVELKDKKKKSGRPVFEPVINFINRKAPKFNKKKDLPEAHIVVDVKEPEIPETEKVQLEAAAPDIKVEGPEVTVEGPEVKVEGPEVKVEGPEVKVEGSDIPDVPEGDIKVEVKAEPSDAGKDKKKRRTISFPDFFVRKPKAEVKSPEANIVVNIEEPDGATDKAEDGEKDEAAAAGGAAVDGEDKNGEKKEEEPTPADTKDKKPKRSVFAPVVNFYHKKAKKPKAVPEANIVVNVTEPEVNVDKPEVTVDEPEVKVDVTEVKVDVTTPAVPDVDVKVKTEKEEKDEEKDDGEKGIAVGGEVNVDISGEKPDIKKKEPSSPIKPVLDFVHKLPKIEKSSEAVDATIVVDVKEPEKPAAAATTAGDDRDSDDGGAAASVAVALPQVDVDLPQVGDAQVSVTVDEGDNKDQKPPKEPSSPVFEPAINFINKKAEKIPKGKKKKNKKRKGKNAPEANIVVSIEEPKVPEKPEAEKPEEPEKPKTPEPTEEVVAGGLDANIVVDIKEPEIAVASVAAPQLAEPKVAEEPKVFVEPTEANIMVNITEPERPDVTQQSGDGEGDKEREEGGDDGDKKHKISGEVTIDPVIKYMKKKVDDVTSTSDKKHPDAKIVVNISEPQKHDAASSSGGGGAGATADGEWDLEAKVFTKTPQGELVPVVIGADQPEHHVTTDDVTTPTAGDEKDKEQPPAQKHKKKFHLPSFSGIFQKKSQEPEKPEEKPEVAGEKKDPVITVNIQEPGVKDEDEAKEAGEEQKAEGEDKKPAEEPQTEPPAKKTDKKKKKKKKSLFIDLGLTARPKEQPAQVSVSIEEPVAPTPPTVDVEPPQVSVSVSGDQSTPAPAGEADDAAQKQDDQPDAAVGVKDQEQDDGDKSGAAAEATVVVHITEPATDDKEPVAAKPDDKEPAAEPKQQPAKPEKKRPLVISLITDKLKKSPKPSTSSDTDGDKQQKADDKDGDKTTGDDKKGDDDDWVLVESKDVHEADGDKDGEGEKKSGAVDACVVVNITEPKKDGEEPDAAAAPEPKKTSTLHLPAFQLRKKKQPQSSDDDSKKAEEPDSKEQPQKKKRYVMLPKIFLRQKQKTDVKRPSTSSQGGAEPLELDTSIIPESEEPAPSDLELSMEQERLEASGAFTLEAKVFREKPDGSLEVVDTSGDLSKKRRSSTRSSRSSLASDIKQPTTTGDADATQTPQDTQKRKTLSFSSLFSRKQKTMSTSSSEEPQTAATATATEAATDTATTTTTTTTRREKRNFRLRLTNPFHRHSGGSSSSVADDTSSKRKSGSGDSKHEDDEAIGAAVPYPSEDASATDKLADPQEQQPIPTTDATSTDPAAVGDADKPKGGGAESPQKSPAYVAYVKGTPEHAAAMAAAGLTVATTPTSDEGCVVVCSSSDSHTTQSYHTTKQSSSSTTHHSTTSTTTQHTAVRSERVVIQRSTHVTTHSSLINAHTRDSGLPNSPSIEEAPALPDEQADNAGSAKPVEQQEPEKQSAKEVSKVEQLEVSPQVQQLLALQTTNGCWTLDENFADCLGTSAEKLQAHQPGKVGDVWATALALSWLNHTEKDRRVTWVRNENKALKWLDGQSLEGYNKTKLRTLADSMLYPTTSG